MRDEHVLCAGDLFIRAHALAAAATASYASQVTLYSSRWPDEPFGPVNGVREAAGEPAQLAAAAAEATVIVTHLAPITRQVIEAAPLLKVIGVTRGGPVNVDLGAASEHRVPVLYLPGRNLHAVAEFVIGAMISLSRGITVGARQLAAGTWDAQHFRYERSGPELGASTIGLVGLGAIGARVAQLLHAFGATVLAYDPHSTPQNAAAVNATLVPLPVLLQRSDIVSLHARLTPETRSMFTAETFASMKPGARFVNTARGELVDQNALLAALETGQLAGAAIDVFNPEPPHPDDPLLSRTDLIATPHLAGGSQQVADTSIERITTAISGYLTDGRAEHCANPDTLPAS